MPTIRRTIKNVVWNYSDAQIKVREATSNDPWGPSSTLMSEIADLTYNVVAFTEIMQMIWKRLNDHGKNWRHVYKSLVLLDYIIKTGSEKVAQQCKENIYAIQTLKDFQYTEDNKDQGMNVREKAKQLVSLLKDDERLRNERAKALKAKERFAQNAMGIGSNNKMSGSETDQFAQGKSERLSDGDADDKDRVQFDSGSPNLQSDTGGFQVPYVGATGYNDNSPSQRRRLSSDLESARPSSLGEEELQLQLALAMSKEEHEEELKKQKSDDIKLAMAIEQSKKDSSDEVDSFETGPMNANHKNNTDPWGVPIQETTTISDPWLAGGGGGGGASASAGAGAGAGCLSSPRSAAAGTETTTTASAWESPITQKSSSTLRAQTPVTDPWGVPISSPERSTPQSMSTPSSHPQSATPQSPWGSSAATAATQSLPSVSDAFAPQMSPAAPAATSNGVTNNSIDEAFDMLSNRNTTTSPVLSTEDRTEVLDGFDPLADRGRTVSAGEGSGSSSSDPWLMSGVGKNLPEQDQVKKKTPKDFLGENASLVNLDNLVSKTSPSLPKDMKTASDPNQLKNDNKYSHLSRTSPCIFEAGTNPFTGSGTNPFEQSTTRVPLRQMQQTQQQGFTQMNNSEMLPRPLIPLNTSLTPPMQQPAQPSNPFL